MAGILGDILTVIFGLLMLLMTALGFAIPLLFMALWLAFIALIVIIAIAAMAVWVMMLLDCIKREEFKAIKGENAKMMWVLILMFTGAIGAVIYYFLEKHEPKKK